MTRFLLDINTLLALLDPLHVFHEAAHVWAKRESRGKWLTCPLVQNGVLRIASQSKYPNSLGTVKAVREVLQAFCADSRHEFCPDDFSLLDSSYLVRPELLTPSTLTDLYLLALARHHDARLATFDRRIPSEAIEEGPSALAIIET